MLEGIFKQKKKQDVVYILEIEEEIVYFVDDFLGITRWGYATYIICVFYLATLIYQGI